MFNYGYIGDVHGAKARTKVLELNQIKPKYWI